MLMHLYRIPCVVKVVVVLLESTGADGGGVFSRDKIYSYLKNQTGTANMLLTLIMAKCNLG